MACYRRTAPILNYSLPQLRATRRTNLALLTGAIPDRSALAMSVLAWGWRREFPYFHHHGKKRLFRFLPNTGFDTATVRTAKLRPICQGARMKGLAPIMIDRSDLGEGCSGLSTAVRFRGRELALLSWVSTPQGLEPSQNRVEGFLIGRLPRHLPTNIRRLLLAADPDANARVCVFQTTAPLPWHAGHPEPGLRILPRHPRAARRILRHPRYPIGYA